VLIVVNVSFVPFVEIVVFGLGRGLTGRVKNMIARNPATSRKMIHFLVEQHLPSEYILFFLFGWAKPRL
jgi:hypothetical protein